MSSIPPVNPISFAIRFAQTLLMQKTNPTRAQKMIEMMMRSEINEDGRTVQDLIKKTLNKH